MASSRKSQGSKGITAASAPISPSSDSSDAEINRRVGQVVDSLELYGMGVEQDIRTVLLEQMETDASLAKEMRGWSKLLDGECGHDLPDRVRIEHVKQSRILRYSNGYIRNGIQLYTNFGVGSEGIKITITGKTAAGDGKSGRNNRNYLIDEFWYSLQNEEHLSQEGQKRQSDKLLTDGEVFLGIFEQKDSPPVVRTFDPLEITELLSNPDDYGDVWGYKREYQTKDRDTGKTTQKTKVYRDFRTFGRESDIDTAISVKDKNKASITPDDGVWIIHVKINTLGRRGYPIGLASLAWARWMVQFMQARSKIQAAISRIAHKMVVKGTAADVARAKQRFQSSIAQSLASNIETNPPPSAGGMFFHNDSSDIEAMKFETGAQAAQIDGSMAIQTLSIGMSLFGHYMGAGEAFRLATAISMEAPMRVAFKSYQATWDQAWTTLLHFVYALKNKKWAASSISISIRFPRISQINLPSFMTSLSQYGTVDPAFLQLPAIREQILTEFDIDEVTQVREEWEKLYKENLDRVEENAARTDEGNKLGTKKTEPSPNARRNKENEES